ncbi:MAG: amino acid kinase family protein [Candidatus Hodarchaeales archaeon]|jgi:aspartokinase-like uncharacterized kinase
MRDSSPSSRYTSQGDFSRFFVKIGGSCLQHPRLLEQECKILSKVRNVVIVPGGGCFADVVREQASKFNVGDTPAHWMAILAMNQFGYLLSKIVAGSLLCESIENVQSVQDTAIAIWLPYLDMRAKNPFPHSWDVSSDSIAAWLAVKLGSSFFVKITAFQGDLPPINVSTDSLLQKTRLIDSFLPGYLDKFGLECHVLYLSTISSHEDYYSGKRSPDITITPRSQ